MKKIMSRASDQPLNRVVAIAIGIVLFLVATKAFLEFLDVEDAEFIVINLAQLSTILFVVWVAFKVFLRITSWLRPSAASRERQLPSSLRRATEYLRQSIIDSERLTINDRELRDRHFQLPTIQIAAGKIDPKMLATLRRREEFTEQGVDILISPVVLRRSGQRGMEETPEILIPFWIPAILGPEGELLAPERTGPWIPREYLEPIVANTAITVGELEVYEQQEPIDPHGLPFRTYWEQCLEFFRDVCSVYPRQLSVDGYKALPEPMFLMEESGGGTESIIRMYNDILDGNVDPGLIQTLTSPKPKSRKRIDERKGAILHSGQFESTFPLSPSQRRAVHAALTLKDGEVLAVTGPPGTGKTTMIQSIVASYWVNSARQGVPRLMLSCSATNQATMNVLHSFAKAKDAPGPLQGRWLPNLYGYGLFCASEAKSRDVTDLLYTLSDGRGPLSEFESEVYRKQAEEFFLERCRRIFPKVNTLGQAAKSLQKEINRKYGVLLAGLNDPEALDQGVRHSLFQLTSHYWEARWLTELPKLIARVRSGGDRPNREDWEIRAMIAPLFVSTFAKAPAFFGGRVAREKPPIDLFFSDEASQTSPDLSGATLALSRRGVIIGDLQQLEPYSSLPESADVGNLTYCKIIRGLKDPALDALRSTGQLASSGSLMRQAISASVAPPGVFLSEHRRSVPQIVDYSNRLCYDGKLQPLRPDVSDRLLPTFGYAHIRGMNRLLGTSRWNKREAERIRDWVRENKDRIEQHYQKPLDEVLGIITPFRAQMALIRGYLLAEFPNLLIGTVNAIQGAERDIVVFSSVYSGRQQKTLYLLDRRPNLLNVAVSRAKDSFLVFGDMEVFETGKGTPSSLLAEFLFASEENELPDVTPVPVADEERTVSRHFDDLDAHREVLIEALQCARRRLIIVSPTISIHPIMHDSIDREVRDAVSRGVEVLIFTDEKLNLDPTTSLVREPSEQGRQVLANAGARVFVVNNIHNKSLAVDDEALIDGSFNWLSAVRVRGAATQKYERSIECRGVSQDILHLLSDMQSRVISEIAPTQ